MLLFLTANFQSLELLEDVGRNCRQHLKQHAFKLFNRSTTAANQEDRERFARSSAECLELARKIVPWCLAVKMLALDMEVWEEEDEDDEILIKRLAVSQALEVFDEERLC